jgi:serpin B
MMKQNAKKMGTLLAAAALLMSAACGETTSATPPAQVVKSELERDQSPQVSEEHKALLNAGNAAFAFDLYGELTRGDDGNVFLSPLSISTAFAMVYAGARYDTEIEMADTLHYDLGQGDLHPAYNWLDLELESRGKEAEGSDDKPFRLKVANALWGLEGYGFEPDFLDTLALNYGAGLSLLDFIKDPVGAVKVINDWVSEKTEGTIPKILTPDSVNANTRLVLTNAVYFNAAWAYKFNEDMTADAPFDTPQGEVIVPTMRQTEMFQYGVGEGYQAVALPYDGHELSMVIVLPDAGTLDTFESTLTSESFGHIAASLSIQNVDLSMPKFEFATGYDLVKPLKALGMSDAFSSAADFSGIDGTTDLQITGALHKAYVRVHEGGTEAAGATAITVGTTSVPPPPVEMSIVRPFFFAIRDHATDTLVFLGRVVDPSS